jgi:hypothetical protein
VSALTASTAPALLGRDLADDLATTALTLAGRIASGATLWCVAPSAPAHAAHLAVEFLHPVIMGKRAVPAIAVEGGDARARLRHGARPGDVMILLGRADDTELEALAPRAGPWGLTSIWFAIGATRGAIAADHVLRVARSDDETVELVLAYHLLWELTHVVFEHPGLVAPTDDVDPTHCATCSDEGQLAEIVHASEDEASVLRCGEVTTVAVQLVGPLQPGDLVLVHAGVAIARVGDTP